MADKVIGASLKLDSSQATSGMKDFSKATDQVSKELGQTNEEAKKTTGSFNTLKDGLSKIPGPLGAVNSGVNTVNTSLKALAANPIVLVITLLVAALVAVYKAFASTEAGAEKIEQVFSGLGAIVTVIRDRILALAGAVISFFKGDFKAAIEQTKAAVTGVGDAIVQAYSEAADATRELQEAQDELNRGLLVSRAKLNRDLAATKELISDQTATSKERKAAIDEVRKAEEAQTAAELANAEKTLKALERKIALDAQDADLQDEYAKQQARVFEIQEEQAQNQRSLNKQARQIEQDEQAKANEAAQKAHEASQKRLQEEIAKRKELDELHKKHLQFLYENNSISKQLAEDEAEARKKRDEEDKKATEERTAWQTAALEHTTSGLLNSIKAQDAANKQSADLAKKIADEKIKSYYNIGAAASALADLFGRQTIAGKALAAAQATINTWLGVTEILKTPTLLPEPLATINRIASITAVVASGLNAVRNIGKVNPAAGSGAGDASGITSPSLTSPAAPIAPQQQNTGIDQTSIAGIGNAVVGRTYVVSQDVEHDMDRNERLNRAARLDG